MKECVGMWEGGDIERSREREREREDERTEDKGFSHIPGVP